MLQPLAFVITQTLSNICTTMASCLRYALLILHYPMVICTVSCSNVGTVVMNKNELILCIVKRIARANNA